MNNIKHFLRSTAAKGSAISMTTILIIAAVGFGAYWAYTNGYFDDLDLSFSATGGTGNKVDVNKKIQFTWTAEWSGTVANAKTFYVYDESLALRETLTTAATGIVASSQNYPSGTKLYIKYDDTNNQIWYEITVPQMTSDEAQSQTYNDVSLKYYAIGTYTVDTLRAGGIDFADGSTYNVSSNGTTPTFIYTLANTGADNTGLIDSYDPIYKCAWQTWVTGKISGDNASLVIVNGADYVFTVGTDTYFAERVSSSALSKWKVGASYVPGYTGGDSCSWSLDLSGFTATSAATMQITVYSCADPVYAMTHAGNFGVDKVTLAEQTVSLVDI